MATFCWKTKPQGCCCKSECTLNRLFWRQKWPVHRKGICTGGYIHIYKRLLIALLRKTQQLKPGNMVYFVFIRTWSDVTKLRNGILTGIDDSHWCGLEKNSGSVKWFCMYCGIELTTHPSSHSSENDALTIPSQHITRSRSQPLVRKSGKLASVHVPELVVRKWLISVHRSCSDIVFPSRLYARQSCHTKHESDS